jgi:hypothetical protein
MRRLVGAGPEEETTPAPLPTYPPELRALLDSLNLPQRGAVEAVLGGGAMTFVEGYPGSGKTKMLGVLIRWGPPCCYRISPLPSGCWCT